MKIAVAFDHAGFELAGAIADELRGGGHDVKRIGPEAGSQADYPDVGAEAARRVAKGEFDAGVFICGTGVGMSIVANKVPGVRAALCTSEYMAEMARRHNDANVLCLGARVVGKGLALGILRAFLNAGFDGGRHARRVSKIADVERCSADGAQGPRG